MGNGYLATVTDPAGSTARFTSTSAGLLTTPTNQLNPVAELDGAGNVISCFVFGTRLHVRDYLIKGGVI